MLCINMCNERILIFLFNEKLQISFVRFNSRLFFLVIGINFKNIFLFLSMDV